MKNYRYLRNQENKNNPEMLIISSKQLQDDYKLIKNN